jgi:hypothetical protein
MTFDKPNAERQASAQTHTDSNLSGRRRLRLSRRASAFLGIPVLCLFFVASASAATQAPEVQWEAASEVSATGATAEASINPEGGETSYEIWLECREAPGINQPCEPLTANPQRRQGTLPSVSEPVIVTDVVTGLQPGDFYKYRVVGELGWKVGHRRRRLQDLPVHGALSDAALFARRGAVEPRRRRTRGRRSPSSGSRTRSEAPRRRRTAGKGSSGTSGQGT